MSLKFLIDVIKRNIRVPSHRRTLKFGASILTQRDARDPFWDNCLQGLKICRNKGLEDLDSSTSHQIRVKFEFEKMIMVTYCPEDWILRLRLVIKEKSSTSYTVISSK